MSADVDEICDFEKIRKYRNDHNKFARYMGIETTEIKRGYARGSMMMLDEYKNAVGSGHGGCIFTLADTIGGAAAASYGMRMTTVSCDFHYLSSAMDTKALYAEAEEIKHGKRISVYDVTIRDDRGSLLAKGTFSFFNLGTSLL